MNSPIKWVGGKRNMRKELVAIMPEHFQYVEVFAGALWVMLEKEPCKLEIINDINDDLINFYKVIQDETRYKELINRLYFMPKSRELFDECDTKIKNKEYKDEIDHALMFYYLLKLVFGGRFDRVKKSFCVPNDGRKNINYEKFPEEFLELHERFKDVYIEKQDYKYILDKYDREDGLFFLDPPYLDTTEHNYGVSFGLEEYKILKDKLSKLKGKWILTCNDKPELRKLFKEFNIKDNEVHYSVSGKSNACKKYKELIITNYKINNI
ncbi:DNA adenine methylase [Clostridium haemolyticum]|nr:Dam family site-specific DNA-(adenine-N6)-methyltransferase [Clostridium haemolyticum]